MRAFNILPPTAPPRPQPANAVAITGGAINGTPIGGATPAAGAFTTLTSSSGIPNASLASFVAPTAWTPTDGSGAGLSLTVTAANYTKIGCIGMLTFDVTYPVTADTSAAKLTSVPAALAAVSGTLAQGGVGLIGTGTGFSTITGTVAIVHNGTTTLQFLWGNLQGSNVTNANLSGARIRCTMFVLTAT